MHVDNISFIKAAFLLASKTKADAIFLHIDPLDDLAYGDRAPPKKSALILLSRKKKLEQLGDPKDKTLAGIAKDQILLPKIGLTRMSLMKVATTIALSSDLVKPGAKIVFAIGHGDGGKLDMIHFIDTAKESEVVTGRGLIKIHEMVNPELFQAVLNIAIELADKGREGKPIGTIFVLGDHEKVLQLSRQMIINPFKGYSAEERHILSPGFKETIREFAALDGAFIIDDEGVVLTAGRYLGAAVEESTLPRGIGSRHQAAAGITALTKAVAFAISESSGDVRIFKNGKIIMHIEKAPSKK